MYCDHGPQELDDFLEIQEIQNQRKKEMLYQKWLKNVFNPVHSKLSEIMKGSLYKEYDNKKRALFEKYLQYRNKKVNNKTLCVLLKYFNTYRVMYFLIQWMLGNMMHFSYHHNHQH